MQAHRTQDPRPPQAETHLDTVCLGSQTSANLVRVNTTIVGVTPSILIVIPLRAPVTAPSRKEAIMIDTEPSNCQQVRCCPLPQLVSEVTASRPIHLYLQFSTLVPCSVSVIDRHAGNIMLSELHTFPAAPQLVSRLCL
jgi:hypothetical protein